MQSKNILINIFHRISPWSTFFNDDKPGGRINNRGSNHIIWIADSSNMCKLFLINHILAGWWLNHIVINIYRNSANLNDFQIQLSYPTFKYDFQIRLRIQVTTQFFAESDSVDLKVLEKLVTRFIWPFF